MNESSTSATKLKSTEVYRARTGRVLTKVTIALPGDLVARFRGQCAHDRTCMSTKLETWISGWLESIGAPPASPPSNGSPQ
jgi:hypothetical protein